MQGIVIDSRHSSRGRSMNVAASAALFALTGTTYAIDATLSPRAQAASSEADSNAVDSRITDLTHEVEDLKRLVHELQAQLPKQTPAPADTGVPPGMPPAAPSKQGADFLRGLTINALLDTYYEYNTNSPIGRVNTLRAYDVSSNSFSLSQADVVLESAPDLSANKRFGARIDLQFGQATAATQGNSANELRPDLYRNVYQAYGPTFSRWAMDSRWTSASGRALSASKATAPRISSTTRAASGSTTYRSITRVCARSMRSTTYWP
jgi:Putative beta-barrel porin-2, OmpL-like. bbp2